MFAVVPWGSRMRESRLHFHVINKFMTAKLIDGKGIAAAVRHSVRTRVEARRNNRLRIPGLAVVLVGQDPASEI